MILLIKETDLFETTNEARIIGIASSIDKAVELIKEDADALDNLSASDTKILIEGHEIDCPEDVSTIFSTDDIEFESSLFLDAPEGWKESDCLGGYLILMDDHYSEEEIKAFKDEGSEIPERKICFINMASSRGLCPEIMSEFEGEPIYLSQFKKFIEFEIIEEAMAEFDLEPEDMLKINPFMYFSESAKERFADEYM